MAEYIEREEIMNRLFTEYATDSKADVFELIRSIPAADVQPVKRGEWICNEELYYNGMAKCSCCEAEFYVEDLQTLQGDAECVKYCPNCGADMIEPETTKG